MKHLLLTGLCLGALAPLAAAQTQMSPSYSVQWNTVDGGGGARFSASYAAYESIGQTSPTGISLSASFQANGGFHTPPDTDTDGIRDFMDNCTLAENPTQYDSNGDGFGNLCDGDLNNDGFVNLNDLVAFKAVFFSADGDADLDGSGFVNLTDLVIFKPLFFAPPGPSGIAALPRGTGSDADSVDEREKTEAEALLQQMMNANR